MNLFRAPWRLVLLILVCLAGGCAPPAPRPEPPPGPLAGFRIALDPGHGHTAASDRFRVGPGGEREEWINLRVGLQLRDLLEEAGAEVVMTRTTDSDVNLAGRAAMAILNECDLFISIHHNGSRNDTTLDFPLVYFHGRASENPASVDLAHTILKHLLAKMDFKVPSGAGVYSDHLIYPAGTAVLRNSVAVLPGIIGEAGYFTNAAGEIRLRSKEYNTLEAQAYAAGIREYLGRGYPRAGLVHPREDGVLPRRAARIEFRLEDGLGGQAFDPGSLLVTMNGDTLTHTWDSRSGILQVYPELGDQEHVTLNVYGRTRAGNALHPREWTLLTAYGDSLYSVKTWREAVRLAGERWRHFQQDPGSYPDTLSSFQALETILRLYRLSLSLQPHHPLAAATELEIARVLELLSVMTGSEQRRRESRQALQRVVEYYPGSTAAAEADQILQKQR